MRVLISGATGLMGTELARRATAAGDVVYRLTRSPKSEQDIPWNPAAGQLNAADLAGFDAIVHLAGESIASGRWTSARKQSIRDSRVQSTRLLVDRLAAVQQRPAVFICASAIGYYGDRGDEVLTESSAPGRSFLSDVCTAWEAEAERARASGIRVAMTRFGVILSPRGGALQKMLTPFRLGLGGLVGNGRQYWSWITLDDVVQAVRFIAETPTLSGPINVVAPRAVTNAEFTKTLGRVLHRPTLFPLPAPIARLVLGEMADELLLASARVQPSRLIDAGYRFAQAELEAALRQLLS